MSDSFATRRTLDVNGTSYAYYSLPALAERLDPQGGFARLPYSLKILLENLLRCEDGVTVLPEHIQAVAQWEATREPDTEIAFMPARVVLQDFTGVPCVVNLAAMRDAVVKLGGSPDQINPLIPSELVIDHSIQVDVFGKPEALDLNGKIEFDRNKERYGFLRWGQKAFDNFKVVPPNTGIVHQVNLENLARVVMTGERDGQAIAYPDTVFGTDSHTTMINGIGVLGWGVGGIEAEAAMLGQPSSMLIPQVVGFKLTGKTAGGCHRHRPGADRHPDAAQAGGGGQVCRVLRRRPAAPAASRPRHHRQHGTGVRRHLRHLPDRQRVAELSASVRPQRRTDRAGRGLRQGAGPVAYARQPACRVQRHAAPGHGRCEALPRRPKAPAGPRAAAGREAELPR